MTMTLEELRADLSTWEPRRTRDIEALDAAIHELDESRATIASLQSQVAKQSNCEAELASHAALLSGTTLDGRHFGLHGTPESVLAVSDALEELAALKKRIAQSTVAVAEKEAFTDDAEIVAHGLPLALAGKRVALVVLDE